MKNFKNVQYVLVVVVMFLALSFSTVVCAAPNPEGSAVDTGKAQVKAEKSGRININTANANELMKLPRVGRKIAERIIDSRKKDGKFKKPADLMRVKGIGEKTFANLKDMITI